MARDERRILTVAHIALAAAVAVVAFLPTRGVERFLLLALAYAVVVVGLGLAVRRVWADIVVAVAAFLGVASGVVFIPTLVGLLGPPTPACDPYDSLMCPDPAYAVTAVPFLAFAVLSAATLAFLARKGRLGRTTKRGPRDGDAASP